MLPRKINSRSNSASTKNRSKFSTKDKSSAARSSRRTRTKCSSTSAANPKASFPSANSHSRSIPSSSKVGDTLEVMIHRIDEMDGTLYLSERRARALKTWEKVIEAHERDEVIEATVTQVVKGGVLVDLGMRGFVPASQIRRQPVGNLDELVGQQLAAEGDRSRSQTASRRALAAPRARRRAAGEEAGASRHARGRADSRRRRRASCGFRRVRRSRRHRRPDSQQRTLVRSHQASVGGRKDRRRRSGRDHEVRSRSEEGQPFAQARAARSVGSSTPTSLYETNKLPAQIVKVTPNYMLVEVIPGILAMVPKGEFDATAQFSGGLRTSRSRCSRSITRRGASPPRSSTSPTCRPRRSNSTRSRKRAAQSKRPRKLFRSRPPTSSAASCALG